MDNTQIYEIAKNQSAIDLNCCKDDFEKDHNVIVFSKNSPMARRYLELPFVCNLVSYGNNIVASIDGKYEKIVRDYLDKYNVEHCFETPDMKVLTSLQCNYETRILGQADFAELYNDKWVNALYEKRK